MCLGELAEVIEVGTENALVSGGGRTRTVSLLTLTDPVTPGDWVVIHSGFALARLTAEEAREAIALRTTSPTISEGCHDRDAMTTTGMTKTRRTGLMLALLTAVISGVAIFLNGYGVKAVGNATVYTTAKNVVAALVLCAVVAAGRTRGVTVSRPQGRGQWWGLVAVGVIGGSVPFVLFFEGLARASSTQAAFLNKTLVLWVALLAVVVLKERLQVWHWIAIGLLLVGQAGLSGGFTASIASGELLILAATLLWAIEVVVAKRLLGSLSSWTVGLARMGFGSVALIGWVLATGSGAALLTMDAAQWGWVLLTGVILAGYVATWFAALARAQAVDVTAVLVLAALITAGLECGRQPHTAGTATGLAADARRRRHPGVRRGVAAGTARTARSGIVGVTTRSCAASSGSARWCRAVRALRLPAERARLLRSRRARPAAGTGRGPRR